METSSFAMESSRISPPSIKMASRWEPSKRSYKVSRTTSTGPMPAATPVEHHKHFVLESADSGVADLGEILSAGTRPHSRPRRLASTDGLRITRHFCADLVRLAVQPGAVQAQTEGHQSAQ